MIKYLSLLTNLVPPHRYHDDRMWRVKHCAFKCDHTEGYAVNGFACKCMCTDLLGQEEKRSQQGKCI